MEQDKIIHRLFAAISSPSNVMNVPSTYFGDLLVANRADAVLTKPETK